MNGVTAVRVISEAGTEIQWAGHGSRGRRRRRPKKQARDAVRKIKVDYEVLPHFVKKTTSRRPATARKPAGEQVTGDPEQAFQEAEVVVRRHIRHSGDHPLLPGTARQVIQWKGDEVDYWPSTQNVPRIGGELGPRLEGPAAQYPRPDGLHGRRLRQQVPRGRWGSRSAHLSKAAAASR